jgi:3-phosphoshikimate 1-carboxyvinyltransferase
MAVGTTTVEGLLEGEDVLRTADALRAFGATIEKDDEKHGDKNSSGLWSISGVGVGGLMSPDTVIDMGNSGTGARLLIGAAAGNPLTAVFTGDDSLRARPMGRIIEPLEQFGASFVAQPGGRMPLTVTGAQDLMPLEYETAIPSAQIKSAILLAGLAAPGHTTVVEPTHTRDHTERMLRAFGADVREETLADGRHSVTVVGQPELRPQKVVVPGDPSSAAFLAVAAAICPGSDVVVENVGLNAGRIGLFETLIEMGVDLEYKNRREVAGEPIGDIAIRYNGTLKGISPPKERAPSMIDEFPILAVAAALASGKTELRGLSELRVKETDRIGAMVRGLAACGVDVTELPDGMHIEGSGGQAANGGVTIETELDHRIAMSFLVFGLACKNPVAIDDAGVINTSFPGFAACFRDLGAQMQ